MKFLKEVLLILIGAFIGLMIEVGFESPVRSFFFPDEHVEIEFVIIDENSREPVPNMEVLIVNNGEYKTGIDGEIELHINRSINKEVAIVINDPKGVYHEKSSNFEVPSNKQKFTVLLKKINY